MTINRRELLQLAGSSVALVSLGYRFSGLLGPTKPGPSIVISTGKEDVAIKIDDIMDGTKVRAFRTGDDLPYRVAVLALGEEKRQKLQSIFLDIVSIGTIRPYGITSVYVQKDKMDVYWFFFSDIDVPTFRLVTDDGGTLEFVNEEPEWSRVLSNQDPWLFHSLPNVPSGIPLMSLEKI